MNPFKIFYYLLTAWLPRPLPATQEEYDFMKEVFLHAYGVPDEPQVWATMAGQITSTPATLLRKAWGPIANATKRLAINKLAHENKQASLRQLQDRLEKLMKDQSELVAQKSGVESEPSITLEKGEQEKAIELSEDIENLH